MTAPKWRHGPIQPIDRNRLIAVEMKCEECSGIFVAHRVSLDEIGSRVLSLNENCGECGGAWGLVVGLAHEHWPDIIEEKQ